MNEIKKILAAIAPTKEYAEEIFNYATMMATNLDADLIAANIINSRDVDAIGTIVSMGYKVDGDQYVRSIKDERKQMLDKIIGKSSFPRERIHSIIKVGNPIDELLNIAAKENADMIIMGPKGRTDLEHVILGSVAEKIFRRSPVPILSFRDEKHEQRLKKRV